METNKTRKIYNLIILDASCSMSSIYNQALSGVNETISSIKIAQNEMPEQLQFLTLVSFADGVHPLEVMNKLTPIDFVTPKTKQDYNLRGSTALYDAIGETVTELSSTVSEDDKALVTIITDGYENDSRKWNVQSVRQLVDSLKERGWVFTFIGANQDVVYEAGKIGISNCLKFEATVEGTMEMFARENRSRRRWNECTYRGEKYVEGNFFTEPDEDDIPADRVTPEKITNLASNEIFVFGSNLEGKHNGGASYVAMVRFGAVYGQSRGLQGHSYAIPTVGLKHIMANEIADFIYFAKHNPQMRFLVTAIGCGSAGWRPEDVAPFFIDAANVPNITLPRRFWKVIKTMKK